MKNYIYALGALALMAGAAAATAQTVTYGVPHGRTAALPPAARPAPPADPNAPQWVQLEGYDRHGQLREYWNLVRPQDFDVSNYRGFHTSTQ